MKIDIALIESCKNDSRKAQFELFQICFGFIMSISLRYYKNKEDAQEVCNMVFHKVLQKIGTYHVDKSFKAWLRTITVNTIIDEFRKKSRQKIDIQYVDDDLSSFEKDQNLFDQNEVDVEVLKSMIHKLPKNQNLAFNLIVVDGYSHKEVSEQMDISIGTSKWLLHAARKTLQKEVLDFYNLKVKKYV